MDENGSRSDDPLRDAAGVAGGNASPNSNEALMKNDDMRRNVPRDAGAPADYGAERATDDLAVGDSRTGDVVGETVGGLSGAATGAALGSLGGPIGTVIGALAGAVGGWWSGRAISEAARDFTEQDDAFYRSRFEQRAGTRGGGLTSGDVADDLVVRKDEARSGAPLADAHGRDGLSAHEPPVHDQAANPLSQIPQDSSEARGTADAVSLGASPEISGSAAGQPSYNDARTAYQVGHLAGTNPDWRDRSFDEVEEHLRAAYGTPGTGGALRWEDARGYARDAYDRGRGRQEGAPDTASTSAAQADRTRGRADAAALDREVPHTVDIELGRSVPADGVHGTPEPGVNKSAAISLDGSAADTGSPSDATS